MNGLHNTSTDSVFAISPPASITVEGKANTSQTSEHSRAHVDPDKGIDKNLLDQNTHDEKLVFKNFLQRVDGNADEGAGITATNKIATREVIIPDNFPTDFITNGIKPSIFPTPPDEISRQNIVASHTQLTLEHMGIDNVAIEEVIIPDHVSTSFITNGIKPSMAPTPLDANAPQILVATYPQLALELEHTNIKTVATENVINEGGANIDELLRPPLQTNAPLEQSGAITLAAIDVKLVSEQVALSPDIVTAENNPRIIPQDVKSEVRNQTLNVPTIADSPSPDTQTGKYGSQNQSSGQDKGPPPQPLPQSAPVNEAPIIATALTPDTSQNFIVRAPEIASIASLSQIGSSPVLQGNIQTSHIAVQQVGEALMRLTDKSGDIVVRLDPAELGRININFTFDKGNTVHAHVIAETSSTAAILRERADVLNLQLKQAGFENINLSFDTASDSSNKSGFGSQFSDRHPSQQADNQNTPIFDIVDREQNSIATLSHSVQRSRNLDSGIIDMKL